MMAGATEEEFALYELREADGKKHTLLKVPKSLPTHLQPGDKKNLTDDVFNILMADTSGSMTYAWPEVAKGWQMSIQDKLIGQTKIFVFSSSVHFIREGAELTEADFRDGGTDLTSALQTIRTEVLMCTKKYIRVFIVTDGGHNHGAPEPETEISKMTAPPGKTIDVFLLGISSNFPVNYSIDIRSMLHNGSANLPSLFWAKKKDDIVEQMMCIGEEVGAGMVTLSLNHEGYVLPGAEKSSLIHLGEWLYFPEEPEKIPALTLKVNEEQPQSLAMKPVPMTINFLLDQTFRQWNSVFIQLHRRKLKVPMETFDLMESVFKYLLDQKKTEAIEGNSIKARIHNKYLRSYQTDFSTLMNQSKKLITIEGKFLEETELAEAILKTTVNNRKYDTRNLKMKGHGMEDYKIDVDKFKELYNGLKDQILQLEPPTPEECCRITMTSTLQDLQDPDFLSMLEENKFEFLKSFTMTGIPVYAPIRDASQINPWTMGIKHILVTPFTVLSQRAIEGYVEMVGDSLGTEDKDVMLQEGEESSRFNVIIPTVPAAAAKVLKPLVRTNLYSLLTTFCVLKNPHILDHNAHIAALACAWVRSVSDHPLASRPEYVCERLENLDATAKLYMDRKAIVRYINVLISDPKQALMTESTEKYDEVTIKCESMIKPMFYIHLEIEKFTTDQVEYLLKTLLAEFIGRCLTNYKTNEADATPFTDFFAAQFNNKEKKKELLKAHSKEIMESFKTTHVDLLKEFYSLDDLRLAVKTHVNASISGMNKKLAQNINIGVNIKKVEHLKNSGSCGDVMWTNFKSWATEVGLPEDRITAAFDLKQVFVYVTEALRCRSSRDRLANNMSSYDVCYNIVKKKVMQESFSAIKANVEAEFQKIAESEMRVLYLAAHRPLVMPLSPQQVVEQAQAKGIDVTIDTLAKVYRYDKKLQLVRNACQIPGCPHYLVPRKNFNQHISIEREGQDFPHALHLVSYELSGGEVSAVVEEVAKASRSGRQDRTKRPPIPKNSLDYLTTQIKTLMEQYKGSDTNR